MVKGSRDDGLENIITGLMVEGKDKRTGRRYRPNFLNQQQVEEFYESSDTAAKIIDRLPQDMTREGFTVQCKDFPDIDEPIQEWFEEMQIDDKVEQGLKWGPLYGGAGGIIGLIDGIDPSKEIRLDKIQSFDYFTVMHRYDFSPPSSSQIDVDPRSNNFRKPRFYKIAPVISGSTAPAEQLGRIHNSRIIRFEGVTVQGLEAARCNYWGDSILSRLWNPITNYEAAHESAALIMEDVVKLIFKLKNLTEMIAQGDEDLVKARLRMVIRQSSLVNGFIIEEGEEAESKTTQLAGIPDLLDRINNRLVAATDMPHTIILGDSPSGLGATGESEENNWYDHVKNEQESILRPIYKRLITLFLASKDGPTKGVVPKFTIKFNPLSQPTAKEQAEARNIQQQTDVGYIDRGVLDPEEVADSRFGSNEYSFETKLNQKLRAQLAKQQAQEPDPNNPDPNAPQPKQQPQAKATQKTPA